jgi:(p)ppGpp synthase/HD superfamily hydrolase
MRVVVHEPDDTSPSGRTESRQAAIAKRAGSNIQETEKWPKSGSWFFRAADAAARWHVHQRRKGAAKEPYINHLLEVATLVAEATDGKDPELVIAALLHDAIEDCEVLYEHIAEAFGKDVADLVAEVTDDKTIEKSKRQEAQEKNAHKKTARAKVLKLADKTSNLRTLVSSPAPDWSVKRRLEYIDWARRVVDGLRGANKQLEDQFDEAARLAEQSLRPAF